MLFLRESFYIAVEAHDHRLQVMYMSQGDRGFLEAAFPWLTLEAAPGLQKLGSVEDSVKRFNEIKKARAKSPKE